MVLFCTEPNRKGRIEIEKQHIGHAIIRTANAIRRRTICDAQGRPAAARAAQNFFLFQIYRRMQRGEATYQRDLEREFSLRRSTASGILSQMEKNGLLRREISARDARLKTLVLTPEAVALCEERERRIEAFERALLGNLTQEEQVTLLNLLERVRQNIESATEEMESR